MSEEWQLGPRDLCADRIEIVSHAAGNRLRADHTDDFAVPLHEDPTNPFVRHDLCDALDPFVRLDAHERPRHQLRAADLGGFEALRAAYRKHVACHHDADL